MIEQALAELSVGPWALPLLALLVLADAALVVVPGEIAVTALGALAATTGTPPLWAVVAVAAGAAFAGDAGLYVAGRAVGVRRWRWLRHNRVDRAITLARANLTRRAATAVFAARFVPFARLAVNLVAGATGVPAVRYLPVAGAAALAWAAYQALVGAVVASLIPGGPVVAVIVSIVVAVGLGLLLDRIALLNRIALRNRTALLNRTATRRAHRRGVSES